MCGGGGGQGGDGGQRRSLIARPAPAEGEPGTSDLAPISATSSTRAGISPTVVACRLVHTVTPSRLSTLGAPRLRAGGDHDVAGLQRLAAGFHLARSGTGLPAPGLAVRAGLLQYPPQRVQRRRPVGTPHSVPVEPARQARRLPRRGEGAHAVHQQGRPPMHPPPPPLPPLAPPPPSSH